MDIIVPIRFILEGRPQSLRSGSQSIHMHDAGHGNHRAYRNGHADMMRSRVSDGFPR